jgi:o-succinylbenzoate synthase
MIKAVIRNKEFIFRQPATTSRGILIKKHVFFIILYDTENPLRRGIGECSLFPGLSMDDVENFEKKLSDIVNMINKGWLNFKTPLRDWPSINFAVETAHMDLKCGGQRILFPSEFTNGKDTILINGLIWMGAKDEMLRQIDEKLNLGFHCLKLKIGSISFDEEYAIIKRLRQRFSSVELEIRVDANGAFSPEEALEKLKKLSDLDLHSIEQPILPSQLEEMASLCMNSPLPIALDEELIGKYPAENRRRLLKIINPQFIVLKPGLLGGIKSCEEWISIANEMNIGWWITSALETNIGLNAISQWTYTLKNPIHQGLSTGSLFVNNINSPLALIGEKLYYFPRKKWDNLFD